MVSRASSITVNEDTSWDRVKAAQASKLMTLAPPYLVWPIVGGIGAAFHRLWGAGPGAAWSSIGLTLGSILLTGVTWLVSHHRGILGRGSATATTFAVSMWVTVASVAGFTQPVVMWMWLAGGLVACVGWNIRTVIREKTGMSGVVDPLAMLFDSGKDKANLDGARMATVKAGPRKIDARMALPAGEKTVADVQKKTEHIEGAMGLPPGTMTVTADMDRADRAKVVLSDPRVMRNPIPWPGPSRPGGSIAEPLRPGLWQDLEDVEYAIVGHHLQIMGKTGSGKSIGGGWNLLAETMTRRDVAIFAADITKGDQSLGPLREGLHRFETTPEGVRSLIRDIHAQLKPRTDWLAERGFVNWEPGCGLTYQVLWLEEFPDINDAWGDKGEEIFLKVLKAIRSAGGTVVLSLQRSDYSQMPTIARGQLAHMCFGVANSHDAGFGLSDAQSDADCRPELWGDRQPGMTYLDASTIDAERITMPLRTFDWSNDAGKADVEGMRQHCAQFPAASKDLDKFTAAIVRSTSTPTAAAAVAGDDDQDDDFNPEEALETEDPDPTVQADLDDPIEDDPDDEEWEFTRPEQKMTPEEARRTLLEQLATWFDEGRETFQTGDVSKVWASAGFTRQWAQNHLRKLRALDVLGYDDKDQCFVLHRKPDTA